ncbi:MAG: hypothetical protein WBM41_03490 [Arenicellales bacterium]
MKYLAIGLVFFATAIYAGGWKELTGAELDAAFADKTFLHRNFVLYYDGNGGLSGSWGGENYNGKYYFRDNLYCAVWDDWADGKTEGCWTVEQKKNKVKTKPASGRASKKYTMNVKDGNTKGL